jgi:hypothetical protein
LLSQKQHVLFKIQANFIPAGQTWQLSPEKKVPLAQPLTVKATENADQRETRRYMLLAFHANEAKIKF